MDMGYDENEVVLCYHGPLLYEAKVRLNVWRFSTRVLLRRLTRSFKRRDLMKTPLRLSMALITSSITKAGRILGTVRLCQPNAHTFKTLTSIPEWVHQSRLLRRDETNLALQKKLQQTQRAAIGKDKDPTSHKARERDPNKDREKEKDRESKFPKKELRIKHARPKEEDLDEIDYPSPPKKQQELKLSVPEPLKVVLVDDWEAVTRHGQLVSLPRSPCVDDILLEFKEYMLTEADAPSDVEEKLPSVLIGFKQYFDAWVHQHQYPDINLLIRLPPSALGANLLYRFERAQYADIRRRFIESPDLPPEQWKSESQIYGAEHLVRLIGRCFCALGLEVPLMTLVVSLPVQMGKAKMDLVAMNTIREYSSLLLQ